MRLNVQKGREQRQKKIIMGNKNQNGQDFDFYYLSKTIICPDQDI